MQNGTIVNYYAGIGSRDTPQEVLDQMTGIAHTLRGMNYILRSGGARGADTYFENGSGGYKQIFKAQHATEPSKMLAMQFHPAWHRCKPFVTQLHGRNMMILFGLNLDNPVDFVVCWTPRGAITGGTGQALRAAEFFGIPIINLAVKEFDFKEIWEFRKEMDRVKYQYRGTVINRSNSR